MFEGIKAYAAGIGLVVVLAVLGYFGYTYHSSQEKAQTLQKEVTGLQIEKKDLTVSVEVTKRSGEINNDVVADQFQKKESTNHSFEGISQGMNAKIEQIKRDADKPQAHPVDPAKPQGEVIYVAPKPSEVEAQVSAVRIESMWSAYCVAAPAAQGCKKEQ